MLQKIRLIPAFTAIQLLALVTLATMSCHRGPKGDPIVGRWQQEGASGYIEYFSDGTAMATEGTMTRSVRWTRLEDSRLKIDMSSFGSTSTELFRTSVEGDILTLTNEKGSVETFHRIALESAAHGDQARSDRRLPDPEAARVTMATMREAGTAMMSWLVDQDPPWSGAGQPTLMFDPSHIIKTSDLEKLLVPTYISSVPHSDGWGNQLEYFMSHEGSSLMIRSPGSDGVFHSGPYQTGVIAAGQYGEDIVWADGFFVRYHSP